MSKFYTVKVIDKLEGQLLYECPVEEQDKAFEYAKQMEELGIEVEINSPSVPESLAQTLGAPEEDLQNLRKEILEEINSHNSGCCPEDQLEDEIQQDPPTSTQQ